MDRRFGETRGSYMYRGVQLIWFIINVVPQTSTSGTHTRRQHYSHIPNKRRKQAEKVVTALSTKDDPLKMVKQL